MRCLLGCAVILFCGVFLLPIGCSKQDANAVSYSLALTLPESAAPRDYALERVSKLTIDGKDFSEPRGVKRTIAVESAADNPTVKVEFSFWPNTYTNIIRTKMVKLEKGKTTAADLTSEDPDTPDSIKPIYVPTPMEVVHAMCKMGKVGADDVVFDIGCGDGRLVIQAVKFFGAKKGVGIDIQDDLIVECLKNARRDEVLDKVEFRAADALKIKDFSEASVVLLYLGDHLNEKLKPTLRSTLKPGSRVVSHRFLMGDDWPPDESITINAKNNYGDPEDYKLHLWTIK